MKEKIIAIAQGIMGAMFFIGISSIEGAIKFDRSLLLPMIITAAGLIGILWTLNEYEEERGSRYEE